MFEETNESRNKLDTITYKIIGLAIEVHKQLGPGLLESAYKECYFMRL
jgi:GxxExxY protein